MSITLPSIGSEGNLGRYLRAIQKFPMLTPVEEFMLAQRWREHGDMEAAHKLVASHLRLVAKIARGYRGYGLPLSDLIAEGNVGMMHAVKRFDPDRGFRLATYAMWWIRSAIQQHVLHSWSLVKLGTTGAQKKLFFNLRRLKSQIQGFDDGELTSDAVATIATELEVNEADVVTMNLRLAGPDQSLNAPVQVDGEDEWQDWLADEGDNAEVRLAERDELEKRRKLLDAALDSLNERERTVLTDRRLRDIPATLEVLSQRYGISRERVRQIEARAFDKLQKAIKTAWSEQPDRIVPPTSRASRAVMYPATISSGRVM